VGDKNTQENSPVCGVWGRYLLTCQTPPLFFSCPSRVTLKVKPNKNKILCRPAQTFFFFGGGPPPGYRLVSLNNGPKFDTKRAWGGFCFKTQHGAPRNLTTNKKKKKKIKNDICGVLGGGGGIFFCCGFFCFNKPTHISFSLFGGGGGVGSPTLLENFISPFLVGGVGAIPHLSTPQKTKKTTFRGTPKLTTPPKTGVGKSVKKKRPL